MRNVFANMIKNLQNEDFVKEVDKNIPSSEKVTPEFNHKYNEYQKRAATRKIEVNA